MTPQEINLKLITLGIITGLVFLILVLPIRYFFRKKALENIKNNLLEGEFIVYKPKFTFAIDYFIPFLIGAFIEEIIILFPEQLNQLKFFIFSIFALLSIFIVFIISSTKLVLTNKRMIYSSPFKFLFGLSNYVLQFDYLNYSDIKNFEDKRTIKSWIKLFYVYTNNDEKFCLNYFGNHNEFKSIIEKYR